jgi:hypothetical protein
MVPLPLTVLYLGDHVKHAQMRSLGAPLVSTAFETCSFGSDYDFDQKNLNLRTKRCALINLCQLLHITEWSLIHLFNTYFHCYFQIRKIKWRKLSYSDS